MRVTFFGHRDAPDRVAAAVEEVLRALIEKEKADVFYVGNHGCFDRMVQGVLLRLCKEYPHIQAIEVLAYMPGKGDSPRVGALPDTLLPAEVVQGVPHFALLRRNEWMLRESDTVVCYVTHDFGGAAGMKRKALAKGKRVIELGKGGES